MQPELLWCNERYQFKRTSMNRAFSIFLLSLPSYCCSSQSRCIGMVCISHMAVQRIHGLVPWNIRLQYLQLHDPPEDQGYTQIITASGKSLLFLSSTTDPPNSPLKKICIWQFRDAMYCWTAKWPIQLFQEHWYARDECLPKPSLPAKIQLFLPVLGFLA